MSLKLHPHREITAFKKAIMRIGWVKVGEVHFQLVNKRWTFCIDLGNRKIKSDENFKTQSAAISAANLRICEIGKGEHDD